MSDQLLNILKYFLVALLWLFFIRVLSAVWSEVRKGGATSSTSGDGSPAGDRYGDGAAAPGRARAATRVATGMAGPAVAAPSATTRSRSGASPSSRQATGAGPGRSALGGRLEVVEPAEHRGRSFDLGDEMTVGRGAGCDVQLDEDTFASQVHARLFRRGSDVWVEDLGSTNGTFVNARKLTAPVPLHEGDRLEIGRTVLEVSG